MNTDTGTVNEVLKPCPFCGSPAMITGGGTRHIVGKLPFQVCASRLCMARVGPSTRSEAIKVWNRRISPKGETI